MIKNFTVTNHLGDILKIDLREPTVSGFFVKSVSGLGPVNANINTAEVATDDGSRFNSARLNQRNIVFKFIFCKTIYGESIEDVRQKSYKYFPVKKNVEIAVKTDNRYLRAIGYVENNEADIFSSQEGTQISIICPDPYFYSAGEEGTNVTDFRSIDPMFEFPLINDSLIEKLLLMASINVETGGSIDYEGDEEIGMTIHIHATGTATNVGIYNMGTRETMKIDTDKVTQIVGSGISAGDIITISTRKGEKGITLLREGVTYNILNALGKSPSWFTLSKGENRFAFDAESGVENLHFVVENETVYEGV